MNPWNRYAAALAEWTLLHLVNRDDVSGGYGMRNGSVSTTTRPTRQQQGNWTVWPSPGYISQASLEAHYNGQTKDLIGLHALDAESKGLWVAVDIDAHGDADDNPERNLKYALSLSQMLADLGFVPLLTESNGAGGYHLRILFGQRVDGHTLHTFGRWIVRFWKESGFAEAPETYPKQAKIEPGRYGNWLRLPGKHPKRDHWSTVWNGKEFVAGEAACQAILNACVRTDPSLITQAMGEWNEQAECKNQSQMTKLDGTAQQKADNRDDDLFGRFNRSQTLESMKDLLCRHRWFHLGPRGDAIAFRRPGKEGQGESGNLKLVDGIPIFWCFSSNGGLPSDKPMDPSELRCRLEFGNDKRKLRAKLIEEFGGNAKPAAANTIGSPPGVPELWAAMRVIEAEVLSLRNRVKELEARKP